MPINADYLERCINVLEIAFQQLVQYDPQDVTYDIYRAACVKEFELVLEQSGRLLRMRLREFFASNLQADRLAFKDIFRHAARHGLLSLESAERWFQYRDNRNDTAHDCGEGFAETTLKLLPDFIADARHLAFVVQQQGQVDENE